MNRPQEPDERPAGCWCTWVWKAPFAPRRGEPAARGWRRITEAPDCPVHGSPADPQP